MKELTLEQIKIVEQWARENFNARLCANCKKAEMSLEKFAAAVPTVSLVSDDAGFSRYFPYLVFCCENCGYTIFFNAHNVGLKDDTEVGGGT